MEETQHPCPFPAGLFSGLEERALEVGVLGVSSAKDLREPWGPVQKAPTSYGLKSPLRGASDLGNRTPTPKSDLPQSARPLCTGV